MEFHISRKARDRYGFEDILFSITGDVLIPNFQAARRLAQKINSKRDIKHFPENAVKAGQINALGLLDEILHYIVYLYRIEKDPDVMAKAIKWLKDRYGSERIGHAFRVFVDEFPPVSVYRGEIDLEEYLKEDEGGIPKEHILLEEMVMLWLSNMNPACKQFYDLFDDSRLKGETIYLDIIYGLKGFFEGEPFFGPFNQNLIDMLRSPAVYVPNSLQGQLEYVLTHWGDLLGRFMKNILKSLDLIKEERKVVFTGKGRAEPFKIKELDIEVERFTPDKEWMPRLVLIAKNIYVWLDQLSKKYGYSIRTLDGIPDRELELLRKRGFTGLWLIGVWERSPASQKIKQLCGNPEAISSAYSVFDYVISIEIGGEEAFEHLKKRAQEKGIRLASDMVPNHVGIYSRWTIENPEWFIALKHNPYPWYTFDGPELSLDDKISIKIEDHYYTRTDAAVVFKRKDRTTGEELFIYHGNDGTSMPWNDTAQLNYLKQEVREAMINTILYVAKKFPIIRFDAAMTLTKKHYQRLWFPEPGSGGAIPTRSEYGMDTKEFNKYMPYEFWREVVDRVNSDAPDTLLLAEAFWLLEGYFVRTLGMHRVYNSAFMNMLRDEENGKYRKIIKDILEFDPEILRRLVNFMNNPDEKTAIEQFGKGDKYFGICILMSTMPGLPMFGHGQIEGFTEKYGMEYKRAYFDETPDEGLIERHEREIFPLLHKRYLFAGVDNFYLYDFFIDEKRVDENVFAYSNVYEKEKTLVLYNNKNRTTSGWIKTSVGFSVKTAGDSKKGFAQVNVGEGLGLKDGEGVYTIYRDFITNLEYIVKNSNVYSKGLNFVLGPYGYHVFIDFREVNDDTNGYYGMISEKLAGRGTRSIEEELKGIKITFLNGTLKDLLDVLSKEGQMPFMEKDEVSYLEKVRERASSFYNWIQQLTCLDMDINETITSLIQKMRCILEIKAYGEKIWPKTEGEKGDETLFVLNCWAILSGIMYHYRDKRGAEAFLDILYAFHIDETILTVLKDDFGSKDASLPIKILRIVFKFQERIFEKEEQDFLSIIEDIFTDDDGKDLLQIHIHEGVSWFYKEAYELLLLYLTIISLIPMMLKVNAKNERDKVIEKYLEQREALMKMGDKAKYTVDEFLSGIKTQ
ncbi:MAG: alpha-amylase family glycosyl hydrolase [Syntrophorhabdaceae bacterium]|nr:alpha-amylase family glycosyl hydrolase [Syntrophorhabdaceae bacterium]